MERNSNLVKFGQICRKNYTTTRVRFIVSGDVNPPQWLRLATLSAFMLLTVTCNPTINTECIVVFPLQRLLYERAKILVRYYVQCLSNYHLRCLPQTNVANSAEKYQKEGTRAGKHGVMSLGPSLVFQLPPRGYCAYKSSIPVCCTTVSIILNSTACFGLNY